MTDSASDRLGRLADNLKQGKPTALSRAITLVENETPEAAALQAALRGETGKAMTIGITGPPGAGKSTLVNAFIGELRRRGKTVGVIAVDPSSPLSGGAILGDRIRMAEHSGDGGVFIRSLASRGHLGGLTRTAGRIVDVMDAAGLDVVLIETVGAGQSEVEVADVAGTKLVVSAPGLGDDVQAIKAGILEIADVLVVNKFDLPMAEQTRKALKAMLHLRKADAAHVEVIGTVATTGEGIAELTDAVEAHDAALRQEGGKVDITPRILRNLTETVGQVAQERFRALKGGQVESIVESVRTGEIDYDAAAIQILDRGLS